MAGTLTPGITYIPNIPVIEAVAESVGTLAVNIVTDQVLGAAKALAPVATGAYRASLQSDKNGLNAAVFSDIRYAMYLEFGTSDTPTFATLRRASETANI
jgi:hypothetical protein